MSVVVTPTDLRGSFQKLCSIAQAMLNIDVVSGSVNSLNHLNSVLKVGVSGNRLPVGVAY